MQVNNEMYEALGHTWWSDDAGFEISSLRYCVNPVRWQYFRRQTHRLSLPGRSALDLGCGGGFLAEDLAREGFEVTGLDPAAASLEAARAHARSEGLAIRYVQGRGESLPFADGSFAVVACCDVLEHVDDVRRVIAEASRTLRPGGVFLFDTVNRTVRSWIVLIKLWQDWGLLGFPPNVHVWGKFIKPAELTAVADAYGLSVKGMKGIGPAVGPGALLGAVRRIRAGTLRGPAVTSGFAMRESDDLGMSYMGWAVKRA